MQLITDAMELNDVVDDVSMGGMLLQAWCLDRRTRRILLRLNVVR